MIVKIVKAVASASSMIKRTDCLGARDICAKASMGGALRLFVVNQEPNWSKYGKKRRKSRKLAMSRKTVPTSVNGERSSNFRCGSRIPALIM
jgi:hypothetical protein